MRKFIFGFLILVFLHVAYGIVISQWGPTVWAPILTPAFRHFYDYSGVIDVQTTKSTGGGDLNQVAAAAQEAGLNFIVVTDLNDFRPDIASDRSVGQLLVYQGGKYNYLAAQILNFDLRNSEHLDGPGRSQIVFSDLMSTANHDREAGLIFLAHPFKPGYKWDGDFPAGLDGIELYNLKGIWQEAWLKSKLSFFWSLIVYPFNTNLSFVRLFSASDSREIVLWDKLNSRHSTWAIAGADAESHLRLWGEHFVNVPSYETLFSVIRNHVLIRSELTGQPSDDRKKISEALRHGQFYLSLDLLQDPKGFESYVSVDDKTIYPLGSEIELTSNMNLAVSLPAKPEISFETEIYKDGEKVLTSNSSTTEFAIHSAGVYRSIVRLKVPLPWPDGAKWMNWIFTNPVRVREAVATAQTPKLLPHKSSK